MKERTSTIINKHNRKKEFNPFQRQIELTKGKRVNHRIEL